MLKRLVLISLAVLLAAAPALAAPKFAGRWIFTITIPESPGSNNNRTFTVNVDASPRGASLHGRMTITDAEDRTVGGAWRQASKKVSVTYELPCADDGQCASLILTGKLKDGGAKLKKGVVIVMWDTPNGNNPSLYDTSNGSFSGDRLE
jgi:hypothetical protein